MLNCALIPRPIYLNLFTFARPRVKWFFCCGFAASKTKLWMFAVFRFSGSCLEQFFSKTLLRILDVCVSNFLFEKWFPGELRARFMFFSFSRLRFKNRKRVCFIFFANMCFPRASKKCVLKAAPEKNNMSVSGADLKKHVSFRRRLKKTFF